VRWPDLRLPSEPAEAAATLREAWEAAADRRVEVACGGGVGRTGTALAVLDGVDPADAVDLVRAGYLRRAVETPWQRRFVLRFRDL
jgi:protein-tyrosine phosphatase